MDTIKNIGLGVLVIGGTLTAPIVPSEMNLKYSFQYNVQETVLVESATSTPEVKTLAANTPLGLLDEDGNNKISVAVFEDSKGNEVLLQIPDTQYADMGKIDGRTMNPTKEQYISVLEAVTPKASAAVAIDNVSSAALTAGVAASLTFAKTNGAGSVLLVGATQDNSTSDPTGVTYNGSAMTKVLTGNTPANVSIWKLGSPTTGSSQNVVITFATNSFGTGGAISFTGADTSTVVGASATNHQSVADTTVTVNITTTQANSYLLDTYYLNDRSRTSTPTAPQALQWSADTGVLEGTRGEGSAKTTTTATTYTMSWALSGVSSWTTVTVEVLPTAAATPSIDDSNFFLIFN